MNVKKLLKQGLSLQSISESLGISVYQVKKELDPDFLETRRKYKRKPKAREKAR